MRLMVTAAAAVVALGLGGAAGAQDIVHWDAPSAATGAYSYFPMGTPLRLTTRTELSTKDNHPGDRFYLEVAEPLVYRGQVVVPAGSLAVGEVSRAERNGMWGKRGEMGVRLLYVQTPSGPVRLSGKSEREGKDQRVLAIGGATFVWWPMLFIHGTSARLPADSGLGAYLADDLRFPLSPETRQVAAAEPATRVLPARFDPAAFGRP